MRRLSKSDRLSPLSLGRSAPALYDRIIEVLRVSLRMEQAYVHRIRRYVAFRVHQNRRHLAEGDVTS